MGTLSTPARVCTWSAQVPAQPSDADVVAITWSVHARMHMLHMHMHIYIYMHVHVNVHVHASVSTFSTPVVAITWRLVCDPTCLRRGAE